MWSQICVDCKGWTTSCCPACGATVCASCIHDRAAGAIRSHTCIPAAHVADIITLIQRKYSLATASSIALRRVSIGEGRVKLSVTFPQGSAEICSTQSNATMMDQPTRSAARWTMRERKHVDYKLLESPGHLLHLLNSAQRKRTRT